MAQMGSPDALNSASLLNGELQSPGQFGPFSQAIWIDPSLARQVLVLWLGTRWEPPF